MADVRFTADAEADLADIAAFTALNFGPAQEAHYRSGFKSLFERLAENPYSAPTFDGVDPGLRRARHQSHFVYYRPDPPTILILRILHAARDPAGLISSTSAGSNPASTGQSASAGRQAMEAIFHAPASSTRTSVLIPAARVSPMSARAP